VKALQVKLEKKSEEAIRERRLSFESMENLRWIQNFIGNLGDVINKAKLFDAGILKEGHS